MQSHPSQNNQEAYEQAREFARKKRSELGVQTTDIDIPFLKKICKTEDVKVDMVGKMGPRIRAAYFFDEYGCSIMLCKDLPREPKMFALAHELKHHFLDREIIAGGEMQCGDYNANRIPEIAAEEFAAEFLYPAAEMKTVLDTIAVTPDNISPNLIVEIKRRSPIEVSYTFIQKRLERFAIIAKNQYGSIQFQKLEEKLYPPIYKQDWFKQYRARKNA
jgi:Zn-dependent peptidase ImmA (M78 family)